MKRVVTYIECDVCEEPAKTFDAWKPYSTDLCEVHMKELVQPLHEHLKRVTVKGPKSASSAKSSTLGPSDREVRDWARSNGIDVNPTGRVAHSARDAFVAAHA